MQSLLVKNRLTKSEKRLFEEIPFSVLLSREFSLNILEIESHLFFIFFLLTKYSLEGYFRYLFRSRDYYMPFSSFFI